MLTSQRKAHLLALLARDGRIVAREVSAELGLSEDTIRRDLRELAAAGALQRVHGGALPMSPAVADFAGRLGLSAAQKVALGRAAAGMVRPDEVVFLDGGTTAVQIARHLPTGLEATVVTHSPSVAVELAGHRGVTVEIIGGRLFKHSVVTTGAAAAEAIGRFRVDRYFMGVTGVHPQAGLTTGDAEEAAIKRAIAATAAEVVVVASSEKLGAASPVVVAGCGEVDVLVVGSGIDAGLAAEFERQGIRIERV